MPATPRRETTARRSRDRKGAETLKFATIFMKPPPRKLIAARPARSLALQISQARLRIAKMLQLHAHPIHNRKIQTTKPPILIASVQIIQRAPRLQRAAQA